MKIRAVIFDVDGVLVNSERANFLYVRDTLKHFGHREIKEEEYRRLFHGTGEYVVRTLIPNITEDIIKEAFQTLEKVPVVIGPTSSGGIYLLGMQNPGVPALDGIHWEGDGVFSKIVENLKEINAKYALVAELNSLDTLQDLNNWHT